MPIISIKYGDTTLQLDAPSSLQVINPPILDLPPVNTANAFLSALNSADLTLKNYLAGGKNLLIIVPDRTRKCSMNLFLPQLLNTISAYGYNPANIQFLIANGAHTPVNPEIYRSLLGGNIIHSCRILQHDCDSPAVFLGYTSRGTPVEINPLIMQFERVLVIGGSLPHYFAVYGGGPKMILPGCSSRRSITHNHRLSLNLDPEWKPGSDSGSIEDNPVIQDIIEAVALLPTIYYCGLILSSDELPRRFFAGEIISTYRKLTSEADKLFCVTRSELADLVIVSPGGRPKDLDLLQTHKSMFHASAALKTGGVMILFAQCPDGLGSNNLETLIQLGEYNHIINRLSQEYIINGQAAVSLMQMGKKFSVKMMTVLDDKILKTLNFAPTNLKEVQNLLPESADKSLYFFPAAAMTRFKLR